MGVMRLGILGAVALFVVACGDDDGGACSDGLSGDHVVTLDQRSGTCGSDVAVAELSIFPGSGLPAGCFSGRRTMSADGCDLIFDELECPLAIGPGSYIWDGTLRYAGEGRFEGSLEILVFEDDGALACRSVYDVTFETL